MRTQFVILMVICGLSASVLGQERGYGKACKIDGTIPCTSAYNDPLRCIATSGSDGICGCDTGMFNNIDLNRCVSPHGQKCTVSSDDGSIWRECTDFANCVPSTTLETKEGICRCETGAQHDPKSLHCKLGYNSEGCTKDSDCDMNAALACREGKCQCKDAKYHHYEPLFGVCISLAGGSCSTTGVFDPVCYTDGDMTCTNNVCTCNPPRIPDNIGLCGLPRGESCNSGADCSGTLVCSNGRCECPSSQEYSEEKKSCVIRAGYSCSATSGLPCIENSFCYDGRCTCSYNYEQDDNRKCRGLFGADCDGTSTCYDNGYLQCGTEKTCVCKNGYLKEGTYDKTCKGISGEACRLGSGEEECIAGASCSVGRCSCKLRHEAATNKTICFALHGQECSYSSNVVCSEARHLGCNGLTCVCKDQVQQVYDESKDRCLARAEMACGAAADSIGCVDNSQCQDSKCKCDSGYGANESGECIQSRDNGVGSLGASAILIAVGMTFLGRLL